MKLVKMSLAAAMLMGVSAFAVDNVKVSGDAKLYYSTNDSMDSTYTYTKDAGLFEKASSEGQAALGLGITADLLDNVSAGAHLTALTTLGLYNNLVSNVWEGTPNDNYWFDEAWLAATLGKTTFKVGRMKLDTPLVFSETWSIVENTFEAGVLVNQDLPDTTLVAAYVGQSNGTSAFNQTGGALGVVPPKTAYANVTNGDANILNSTYVGFWNGAYAFGIVNNSFKPLTAQAWYFDAQQAVQAYWLQADLDMSGFVLGGQYTGISYDDNFDSNWILPANQPTGLDGENSNAFAVKLGYATDKFTISGAFSQTDKKGPAGFNLDGGAQSKLYTEAWWNYGYVTRPDTSAWNITATATVATVDLGAYYTSATQKNGWGTSDLNMNEFTLTGGKDFGPLNTTLAYIYTKADDQNIKTVGDKGSGSNTIQAYLTLNF